MNTDVTDVTFSVWQTFRTGLDVARRKALTIIALALVAGFVVSQGVDGIQTFASSFGLSSFGLSVVRIEEELVFFGSLLVMWFAIVPLTIQTIEAPPRMEASGTVIERLWRDASVPYRALSLRTVLRGLGLTLFNFALTAASLLSSTLPSLAISGAYADHVSLPPGVLFLGPCFGLLVALISLRWSLAVPAMIMENVPVRESLRRSWHITKSQVLRLLALSMLTMVMVRVLSALLGLGLGMMVDLFSDTPGDGSNVLTAHALFVGQTVGLVFSAPITAACYYYLRRN